MFYEYFLCKPRFDSQVFFKFWIVFHMRSASPHDDSLGGCHRYTRVHEISHLKSFVNIAAGGFISSHPISRHLYTSFCTFTASFIVSMLKYFKRKSINHGGRTADASCIPLCVCQRVSERERGRMEQNILTIKSIINSS